MSKLVMMAGLFALSTAAQAADNGIYLGAGIGQAAIEIDDATMANFDGNDLGYKIIAGIRPLDWLAVEVNYVNFGSPDDTIAGVKLKSEGDGFTGFAVGFLPLGPVDVFAKVGAISWDAEVTNPQLARRGKEDGTDFAYGVGVQFRLLSLGLRAEYEVFDIGSVDDANMLSLGLTYTFL